MSASKSEQGEKVREMREASSAETEGDTSSGFGAFVRGLRRPQRGFSKLRHLWSSANGEETKRPGSLASVEIEPAERRALRSLQQTVGSRDQIRSGGSGNSVAGGGSSVSEARGEPRDDAGLVRLTEAAHLLGMKPSNVSGFLRRRGIAPAVDEPRRRRWLVSDILAVKAEREAKAVDLTELNAPFEERRVD